MSRALQRHSLFFTPCRRQSQYSHAIHLRCCTSSAKSATIQRKMPDWDTKPAFYRTGRRFVNDTFG